MGAESIIVDEMWWSNETTFHIREKDTRRIITMNGCYVSSLKYNFPNEPEFTNSITLVGNNKFWAKND